MKIRKTSAHSKFPSQQIPIVPLLVELSTSSALDRNLQERMIKDVIIHPFNELQPPQNRRFGAGLRAYVGRRGSICGQRAGDLLALRARIETVLGILHRQHSEPKYTPRVLHR